MGRRIMLDHMTHPNPALVLVSRQVLYPQITRRPATQAEAARLAPWFVVHGALPQAIEIAVFADGSGGHAPETVAVARALLGGQGMALLYRHTGVQVQPLDPLLPGLLRQIGHDGPVHAVRRAEGDRDLAPGTSELALIVAMTAPGQMTLVIDDLQDRAARTGALNAAPVVLSLYRNPPTKGASQ